MSNLETAINAWEKLSIEERRKFDKIIRKREPIQIKLSAFEYATFDANQLSPDTFVIEANHIFGHEDVVTHTNDYGDIWRTIPLPTLTKVFNTKQTEARDFDIQCVIPAEYVELVIKESKLMGFDISRCV